MTTYAFAHFETGSKSFVSGGFADDRQPCAQPGVQLMWDSGFTRGRGSFYAGRPAHGLGLGCLARAEIGFELVRASDQRAVDEDLRPGAAAGNRAQRARSDVLAEGDFVVTIAIGIEQRLGARAWVLEQVGV